TKSVSWQHHPKLEEIIACLDNFDLWVNIVTPN
ncbi:hypothetical protein, partial [Escherichia coli]